MEATTLLQDCTEIPTLVYLLLSPSATYVSDRSVIPMSEFVFIDVPAGTDSGAGLQLQLQLQQQQQPQALAHWLIPPSGMLVIVINEDSG